MVQSSKSYSIQNKMKKIHVVSIHPLSTLFCTSCIYKIIKPLASTPRPSLIRALSLSQRIQSTVRKKPFLLCAALACPRVPRSSAHRHTRSICRELKSPGLSWARTEMTSSYGIRRRRATGEGTRGRVCEGSGDCPVPTLRGACRGSDIDEVVSDKGDDADGPGIDKGSCDEALRASNTGRAEERRMSAARLVRRRSRTLRAQTLLTKSVVVTSSLTEEGIRTSERRRIQ